MLEDNNLKIGIIIMNDSLEYRNSKLHGNSLLWPKHDTGCWKHLNKKKYAFKPKEISELIKTRNLVIQAGGNVGIYPKQYANYFNTVITFEPDYLNFQCLVHNVQALNVFKYQAFLGSDNTPLGIINGDNAGGHRADTIRGVIPQVRIDDLNLAPDLIHLDIEGFEGFAIEGAVETIKKHKPVIVLETESSQSESAGWTKEKLTDLLQNLNYYEDTKIGLDTVFLSKEY